MFWCKKLESDFNIRQKTHVLWHENKVYIIVILVLYLIK